MPIGKDSLKRVTNGGYSKVKSEAPDMENSVVIERARESETPKVDATRTTQSAKKSASTAKRCTTSTVSSAARTAQSAKKSPVSAKPKAAASESAEATPRSGFCPIGSDMPDFLL